MASHRMITRPQLDTYENQVDSKNPWQSLAYAIVINAAIEYMRYRTEDAELFLKSGWCEFLLNGRVDPEWLIDQIIKSKPPGKRGRQDGMKYKGKSINEWELTLGFGKGTIINRLNRGMTMEEAVTTPLDERKSRKNRRGITDG